MNACDTLPSALLQRKAVIYIRQSTQAQVQTHTESRRRQYELVDVARARGFRQVEVIDDDLGRSASGTVARPGFERLVAWLCAGEVGAVLCFDASRLARNGRDWHHLLELCGLVEARVIDMDGVYDPCRPNDRLLLGMKGSISEFELGILRSRMLDAARSKARRGELRIPVPIGYTWHREVGLGIDPDRRVQEVIHLIFARFRECGSARQVLLRMSAERLHFPRPSDGKRMIAFEWQPIRYRNVISVLKNPFYAGVYAYGKSEKRTALVDGHVRKSYGHHKPLEQCEVLLKNHHEGYIEWVEFERNQALLAANAFGKVGGAKSGRGGRALLAGLLTCGRCGRRLPVVYAGKAPGRPVYRCDRPNLMLGLSRCLGFGGSRVDAAIGAELLRAVEPMAIEAALQAERMHMETQTEQRRIAELELQHSLTITVVEPASSGNSGASGHDYRCPVPGCVQVALEVPYILRQCRLGLARKSCGPQVHAPPRQPERCPPKNLCPARRRFAFKLGQSQLPTPLRPCHLKRAQRIRLTGGNRSLRAYRGTPAID